MAKGVPDRCDPPSNSPLIGSWTASAENAATTTTIEPVIVENSGIVIPASGLLCGQVTTTQPPLEDEEVRACDLVSTRNKL